MEIPIWLQFAFVVLTTTQLTETVRHGSIFEGFRAWLESRGPFWDGLINCGFCFSHWSASLATLLWFGAHTVPWTWDPFLMILVWLSAVRCSNLLNDFTKEWSRTPTDFAIPEMELDDDESDPGIDTTLADGSEPG